MEKLTGYELLKELFGEEKAEEFEIYEAEDMDGVEDYEQQSLGVDGWYETILHSFRFGGKLYSVEEQSHASDNVCDSDVLWDTFQEVHVKKTVLLLVSHEGMKPASHKELFDAQGLYEKMVSEGSEKVGVEVDGVTHLTVEIKEYPGTVPAELLELFTNKFISTESEVTEVIPVEQIND